MESLKEPRKPWRLFLPILWMMTIFLLSGQAFSFLHTSRLIIPILHFLWPNLSSSALIQIHAILRKVGHFLEYLLLSYSWYWSLLPRWSTERKASLIALFLSLAYALFDEFHQSLLTSRTGSLRDVLLDGTGAFFMQAIIWLRLHRRKTQAGATIVKETAWRGP